MSRLTDSPMVLPDGEGLEIVREYFGEAETLYVPLADIGGFLSDLCAGDDVVSVFADNAGGKMHVHAFEKQSLIEELRMYKMMWEDGDWDEDGPTF